MQPGCTTLNADGPSEHRQSGCKETGHKPPDIYKPCNQTEPSHRLLKQKHLVEICCSQLQLWNRLNPPSQVVQRLPWQTNRHTQMCGRQTPVPKRHLIIKWELQLIRWCQLHFRQCENVFFLLLHDSQTAPRSTSIMCLSVCVTTDHPLGCNES